MTIHRKGSSARKSSHYNRKPIWCLIKKQFSQGASVYRLHQERLQKRTEERKGRNYDGIGTSRNTLRKIISEGVTESLLSPVVDDSLSKLLGQFQKDINPGGIVKSAIQILSRYPCQVIVFSETSEDLDKQSNYILDNVWMPLLPSHLIIEKVYECRNCQSNVKIRSMITSIPVSISRGDLDLTHDLVYFFSSTSSGLNCSVCRRPTTRHIEVIQWPEILIVHINDRKNSTKYRKPPGTLSLIQFSSWCVIGSPAAAIYDLVCFNSIPQVSGKNNMMRVIKVKKSWQSSIHKRAIGEGEELRKLYGNSCMY